MFKLLAAAIAALTFSAPASAKVDPGSTRLLQTLNDYGVTIEYNPSSCSQGFQGRYTTSKLMTLCYDGAPTAADHDTLRHETAHFLQHCASTRRGQQGLYPLAVNNQTRTNWAYSILGANSIDKIKQTYPTNHHQVEIEAFAMAHHYSANELIGLIKSWCKR
jgi:hypothetical protein